MTTNHNKALEFYKANQAELVEKYNGKILVLKNEEILDVCDSFAEAHSIALGKYGEGNFSLQEVTPGDESYMAFIATPGVVSYT